MASGGMNLEQQFLNFSLFEDTQSDGKTITLTNIDKWLKQAKLLDGMKITNTDTGISFNKMKKRTINFQQFVMFLEDLADTKHISFDEIKDSLEECGLPGDDQKKEEPDERRKPPLRT